MQHAGFYNLSLLTVLLSCAAPTQAAGWYAGLGAGQAQSEIGAVLSGDVGFRQANINFDDSALGWKMFGGYHVTDSVAFELDYTDLGEYRGTTQSGEAVNVDLNIDTKLMSLSVLGHYNLLDDATMFGTRMMWLSLFARGGIYRWSSDAWATVKAFGSQDTVTQSDDGVRLSLGVGAQLGFGPVAARLEWQRFNNVGDNLDHDLVTLSGMLMFY